MTSLTLAGKSDEERAGGELLRQDTEGRVRTSNDVRAELLAEFDGSGISGASFAKLAGIKYQTFANWLHLRRRKESGAPAVRKRQRVTWLEALPDAAAALRVELPGGAWMELG